MHPTLLDPPNKIGSLEKAQKSKTKDTKKSPHKPKNLPKTPQKHQKRKKKRRARLKISLSKTKTLKNLSLSAPHHLLPLGFPTAVQGYAPTTVVAPDHTQRRSGSWHHEPAYQKSQWICKKNPPRLPMSHAAPWPTTTPQQIKRNSNRTPQPLVFSFVWCLLRIRNHTKLVPQMAETNPSHPLSEGSKFH